MTVTVTVSVTVTMSFEVHHSSGGLSTYISMGVNRGWSKKSWRHHPHGVLMTITKLGKAKKMVTGSEKHPTTPP